MLSAICLMMPELAASTLLAPVATAGRSVSLLTDLIPLLCGPSLFALAAQATSAAPHLASAISSSVSFASESVGLAGPQAIIPQCSTGACQLFLMALGSSALNADRAILARCAPLSLLLFQTVRHRLELFRSEARTNLLTETLTWLRKVLHQQVRVLV